MPPGFAHGYVVRSEHAEVAYKSTDIYHSEDDCGILWNDPEIGMECGVEHPILSGKDTQQPILKDVKEKLFK